MRRCLLLLFLCVVSAAALPTNLFPNPTLSGDIILDTQYPQWNWIGTNETGNWKYHNVSSTFISLYGYSGIVLSSTPYGVINDQPDIIQVSQLPINVATNAPLWFGACVAANNIQAPPNADSFTILLQLNDAPTTGLFPDTFAYLPTTTTTFDFKPIVVSFNYASTSDAQGHSTGGSLSGAMKAYFGIRAAADLIINGTTRIYVTNPFIYASEPNTTEIVCPSLYATAPTTATPTTPTTPAPTTPAPTTPPTNFLPNPQFAGDVIPELKANVTTNWTWIGKVGDVWKFPPTSGLFPINNSSSRAIVSVPYGTYGSNDQPDLLQLAFPPLNNFTWGTTLYFGACIALSNINNTPQDSLTMFIQLNDGSAFPTTSLNLPVPTTNNSYDFSSIIFPVLYSGSTFTYQGLTGNLTGKYNGGAMITNIANTKYYFGIRGFSNIALTNESFVIIAKPVLLNQEPTTPLVCPSITAVKRSNPIVPSSPTTATPTTAAPTGNGTNPTTASPTTPAPTGNNTNGGNNTKPTTPTPTTGAPINGTLAPTPTATPKPNNPNHGMKSFAFPVLVLIMTFVMSYIMA